MNNYNRSFFWKHYLDYSHEVKMDKYEWEDFCLFCIENLEQYGFDNTYISQKNIYTSCVASKIIIDSQSFELNVFLEKMNLTKRFIPSCRIECKISNRFDTKIICDGFLKDTLSNWDELEQIVIAFVKQKALDYKQKLKEWN